MYFGHIMRKKDRCLETEIIQGTTPDARAKGRPKTSWLSNIIIKSRDSAGASILMIVDTLPKSPIYLMFQELII